MKLEIRTFKNGKYWLAEVPVLDVMSQAKTRQEALQMVCDAVELLAGQKNFAVRTKRQGKEFLLVVNDEDFLIALMLRRQRQKYGLTLRQIAQRLGASSVNAFARYEQGKSRPTLTKLTELMTAINPNLEPVLRF